MGRAPHVALAAGEVSGDMHAARLAAELAELEPGIRLSGLGGEAMAAAGVGLWHRSEELSLVGFSEVLPKLGLILRTLKDLKRKLAGEQVDLFIPIDFPDFNFRLAKSAKKAGVPVLYYISPQVWAWRTKRALAMAKFVDRLACTFPFEPEFFAQTAPALPVSFVGHPLLDQPPPPDAPLPVPEGAELVGLLPGSRMSEVERILPLLLAAAKRLSDRRPGIHFVLPVAPGLKQEAIAPYLEHAGISLSVFAGRAAQVMRQADLLLIASGTATLQAALAGTPMVVVYKTGAFNYFLASRLVKVDHIAMPNLIAGRALLPELIQDEATPESVAAAALDILENPERRDEMVDGLAQVRERLGGAGASRRVAELALEMIRERQS